LKKVIDDALDWANKPVVLAAYMNYKKTTGTFNRVSVLLCDAVIFSSGATHLELGDGGYMLSSEYFPNRKLELDSALSDCLANYYSFMVFHKEWLFSRFPDTAAPLKILHLPYGREATARSVWTIVKAEQSSGRHLISLVNLLEQTEIEWRDDFGNYPAVSIHRNLTVTYYPKNAATLTSVSEFFSSCHNVNILLGPTPFVFSFI
jgi:dextranase